MLRLGDGEVKLRRQMSRGCLGPTRWPPSITAVYRRHRLVLRFRSYPTLLLLAKASFDDRYRLTLSQMSIYSVLC